MIEKTGTAMPVSEGRKTGIRDRQKTGIRSKKTGTATPESLREPNRDRGSATHSPLSPGESLALSRESDSCISGGRLDGAPDMVLDPTETVPPPRDRKESGAEEIAIAEEAEADPPFEGAAENCSETLKFSPVVPLDQERAFRELRELWQRGWAADDSPKAQALVRQAFAKACRDVTPTAILDAARTWVAAADAPRYLPALPQWLMANGWEKPPPAKATRASHSKRGHNGYQRKGGKPDLMRMSLKRGGYLEDENGKLYHPDGEDGCSFDWRASL